MGIRVEEMSLTPPLERVSVSLQITVRCNIRCDFCFLDHKQCSSLNESVLYERLLPVYKGARDLTLQGGEITVLRGAKEYVLFLRREFPHIRVTLITNGVEFGENWARLSLAGDMDVVVSLNTADGARYRELVVLRPDGDRLWARVFENLRGLLRLRGAYPGSASQVSVSMVITADVSENDITDFVRLGTDLGLPVKLLFDCRPDPGQASLTRLHGLYDHIAGLVETTAAAVTVSPPPALGISERRSWVRPPFGGGLLQIDGATVCRAPWHALTITATGEVLFCPNLLGYVLGNIDRDKDIMTIWHSKRARSFRQAMLAGEYPFCSPHCPVNQNPRSCNDRVPFPGELLRQSRYDEAAKVLEQCVAANLLDASAVYHLAYCYDIKGQAERAIELYERALTLGFDEFWVRYHRGALLLKLGDSRRAHIDLRRARVLDPHHEGARQLLWRTRRSLLIPWSRRPL